MRRDGIEQKVTGILEAMILLGGYQRSLVCTEDGLLVASAGDGEQEAGEDLAAFTSLFDTIVDRATTDLGFDAIDEVTVLDASKHRLIIRPLPLGAPPRMFLVLHAPKSATWRRHTNSAVTRLLPLLKPLTEEGDDVAAL